MIPNRITDSDMICLHSVDSYLKSIGTPVTRTPQEKLIIMQNARDMLYSDIVRRVPRIAAYILAADMDVDTYAQGLDKSLSRHALDPVFINLLMQYLAKSNNREECCITGAYLVKIANKWIETNVKEEKPASTKKGEKAEEATKAPTSNSDPLEPIMHIMNAIRALLGGLASYVAVRCNNVLPENQNIAIAACIAMNNKDTILEIIKSDFPITADIFDVPELVPDPSSLIRETLLLEQSDIPGKPTTNQQAFIDSLTRWVYKKLNEIPAQAIYSFLISTYKTQSPKIDTKFINPKSCGTQYSNLLAVAKQIIN
jgi:hypothetical protein